MDVMKRFRFNYLIAIVLILSLVLNIVFAFNYLHESDKKINVAGLYSGGAIDGRPVTLTNKNI